MSDLKSRIVHEITENGPIPMDRFLDLAITEYYTTQQPFGVSGDFITAPEISQIFGEIIAVWVMDIWQKMGQPEKLSLCEIGPGRGTLMADILRTIQVQTDIANSVQPYLIEISPKLIEQQQETLQQYSNIQWIDGIQALAEDTPFILIGNEFLDALPIKQFTKEGFNWSEHMVGIEEDALRIGRIPCAPLPMDELPDECMIELSPARIKWCNALDDKLNRAPSAALLIDYGYTSPPLGDTIQALYKHERCDILDHLGEADLTSHVDFFSTARLFDDHQRRVVPQGEWLKKYGAEERVQALMQHNPDKADELQTGYDRLVDTQLMGDLFKVLEIRSF